MWLQSPALRGLRAFVRAMQGAGRRGHGVRVSEGRAVAPVDERRVTEPRDAGRIAHGGWFDKARGARLIPDEVEGGCRWIGNRLRPEWVGRFRSCLLASA